MHSCYIKLILTHWMQSFFAILHWRVANFLDTFAWHGMFFFIVTAWHEVIFGTHISWREILVIWYLHMVRVELEQFCKSNIVDN